MLRSSIPLFLLWSIYCLFSIFAKYGELFKAVCICDLCKLNQLVLPQFIATLKFQGLKIKGTCDFDQEKQNSVVQCSVVQVQVQVQDSLYSRK